MEDSLKGPYKLVNQTFNDLDYLKSIDKLPISRKEVNPYVEAFWKWWPELKTKLTHFRITGGEPLLSKNTWRIIDDLIENPQPNLDFAINTNMCVPDELIARLVDSIAALKGKVRQVTIYTSTEGDGVEQEFVRDGMDMQVFWKNVELLLEKCPDIRFVYMTTVNVFSLRTLHQFVERAVYQRVAYTGSDEHRITISFNYLRYPGFLALPTMKKSTLKHHFAEWQEALDKLSNKSLYGRAALTVQEQESWARMMAWALEVDVDAKGKEDQIEFIKQVTHRRGNLDPAIAQWIVDN
jgi:organic radical activating enzyme